ncbi:MAG: hypothetical protein ACK5JD_17485 [Mangrovibacterium sp.]
MKTIMRIACLAFLTMLGCIENEIRQEDRIYIIENGTTFSITIEYYNRTNSDMNTDVSSVLSSRGDRLLGQLEQIPVTNFLEELPTSAFAADSVKIVFNESRFTTCTYDFNSKTFSEPINRNLFKHSNYENLGNGRYLFKITQEDYENALPCNDNCD